MEQNKQTFLNLMSPLALGYHEGHESHTSDDSPERVDE